MLYLGKDHAHSSMIVQKMAEAISSQFCQIWFDKILMPSLYLIDSVLRKLDKSWRKQGFNKSNPQVFPYWSVSCEV